MDKKDLVNVFDYEAAARAILPKTAYDYYRSGANDEITLHDNHAAYERIQLKPKVLIDTSKRDLTTTVLGQTVSMPILVAPTAFHRMAHPDGEVATARAAGQAGTLMMLSTLSTSSIEEVMPEATGPVWFQLYVYKDREATLSLVDRAVSSGCTAIALTVDAQVWGRRERDIRNRFRLPKGLSIKNLMPAGYTDFIPVDFNYSFAVRISVEDRQYRGAVCQIFEHHGFCAVVVAHNFRDMAEFVLVDVQDICVGQQPNGESIDIFYVTGKEKRSAGN